jgi:hypothetical protein
MTDSITAGKRNPVQNPHLYRVVIATMLTVLIVPTQPVYSMQLSAVAVGVGTVLGIGYVVFAGGFSDSLRTSVAPRDLVILGGALLVGVVVVVFVPIELAATGMHGAVAFVWAGSLTSLLLEWRGE